MATPSIKIYSLSTCSHCKSAKKLMGENNFAYDFVDVDQLEGEERSEAIKTVREFNPRCSFPTIVINETIVVGFKPDKIKKALGIYE